MCRLSDQLLQEEPDVHGQRAVGRAQCHRGVPVPVPVPTMELLHPRRAGKYLSLLPVTYYMITLVTQTNLYVSMLLLKCILTGEMPTDDGQGPREHDRAPRETRGKAGEQQQQRQTRGRQRPGWRRRRGAAPLGGSQGLPRGQRGVGNR